MLISDCNLLKSLSFHCFSTLSCINQTLQTSLSSPPVPVINRCIRSHVETLALNIIGHLFCSWMCCLGRAQQRRIRLQGYADHQLVAQPGLWAEGLSSSPHRLFHVAWASSQQGSRIPRTSILRESTRWEPQKPQSITPTVLCQLKQSQTPSWVQGEGPALFLLKREPEHEEQKISSRPLWKNTIHPPPKCRIGCPAQQEWWLNSTSFSSI